GQRAQRAVAHGLRPLEQRPYDRLVAVSRTPQHRRSLPSTPPALANRLVRTRMLGGVRGRGRDAPSYSIEAHPTRSPGSPELFGEEVGGGLTEGGLEIAEGSLL